MLSDGVVKCREVEAVLECWSWLFQLLSDGVVKCRLQVEQTTAWLAFQLLSDGVVKCRCLFLPFF